jgi:DinB superfamily
MRRSREATLGLLARIPDAALRHSPAPGAWSILEVVGHVAAWEREGARRLALIARRRGHRIVWYDTTAEIDAFNADAVRGWRRLGRTAALRRLAAARVRLLAALRRVPARALADPAHALPVTTWLREFGWTHEAAHRRDLQAWWRAHRAEWAAASGRRR